MVEQNHYRWDFIGLSTDTKPTPATSEKVTDGSTYYTSDDSKLYVWYKDQWYEKEVEGGGGGGTTNFNNLSNRPKYNGTEMTGTTDIPEVKTYTAGSNVSISSGNVISATDTTYSAFVGTDGTAAGTAGLVPAPATTDAGKFLKADGTWDTAGGGSGVVTELTSADYNYPTDNPASIAAWLLDDGVYSTKSAGVKFDAYMNPVYSTSFIVTTDSSNGKYAIIFNSAEGGYIRQTGANTTDANRILTDKNLKSSTGTSTTDVMSQNATSSMLFADPGTDTKIKIGSNAYTTVGSDAIEIGTNSRASETNSIAIGKDSYSRSANGGVAVGGHAGTYGYNGVAVGTDAVVTTGDGGVAVGFGSASQYKGGVALGAFSVNNVIGEVNVGSSNTAYGYNSTNYRLISGVHDPVNAHDAATKGYVDANAGGGAKVLSAADFNYPVDNPSGIAFWLLDEGQYITDGQTSMKLYVNSTSPVITSDKYGLFVITKASTASRGCYIFSTGGAGTSTRMVTDIDTNGNNGVSKLLPTYVINTLTSTSTTNALSANQGKELKDLIDALDARVTALEGA